MEKEKDKKIKVVIDKEMVDVLDLLVELINNNYNPKPKISRAYIVDDALRRYLKEATGKRTNENIKNFVLEALEIKKNKYIKTMDS